MTLRHVSEFVFGDLNILWMWPCYHSNYELCLHFVYCCVYVMGTCIHSPHPFGCSKLKSNSKMHSLHSTKCTSSGWQPVCSSDWLPQCLYLSLGSTVVWVTVGNRSFAAAGPRPWIGTVYLSTSSLPRHSQHFVGTSKLIYFDNHIQTLFSTASP